MPYLTDEVRELAEARYRCREYVRKLAEDAGLNHRSLMNALSRPTPDPINRFRADAIARVLGVPVASILAHNPPADGKPSRPPTPPKRPKPDPKRDEPKGPKRFTDRMAS